MTIGILSLPEELLVRTLAHIQNDGRPRCLYNLTLVSKQMNRLATPLLYSNITIDLDGGGRGGYVEFEDYATPFARLVRQILHSPEHAEMVRSFTIKYFAPDYPSPLDLFSGVEEAVRSRLETLLPDVERRSVWQDELLNAEKKEIGEESWMLFELEEERSLPLLKDVIDSNASCLDISDTQRSSIWPCLEEVFVEGLGDKHPDSTAYLALFSRLPWLKTLKGSELGDDEGNTAMADGPFVALQPGSSSIEKLWLLKGCKLKIPNMDRLLQAPKALKFFEYEFGHSWAWVPFLTGELQRALLCQEDSLEELILRLSDRDWFDLSTPDSQVDRMNFTPFKSLKKLTIEPALIFGLEVALTDAERSKFDGEDAHPGVDETKNSLLTMLPQNLETLTIQLHGGRISGSRLSTALHFLLTHEGHEKLSKVRVLTHPERIREYQEEMTMVQQAAATVDVEFSVEQRDPELWPTDPPY